ncbi:MAG TPA: hypothetical protein ENJ82_10445 [Bacteroidetes bacterium]|nr:hypothetical protein [Bacteroidota bacterium]
MSFSAFQAVVWAACRLALANWDGVRALRAGFPQCGTGLALAFRLALVFVFFDLVCAPCGAGEQIGQGGTSSRNESVPLK